MMLSKIGRKAEGKIGRNESDSAIRWKCDMFLVTLNKYQN